MVELDDVLMETLWDTVFNHQPRQLPRSSRMYTSMNQWYLSEHYQLKLWRKLEISPPIWFTKSWLQSWSRLGDVDAWWAKDLLEKNGPYCCGPAKSDAGGDGLYTDFCVYRISETYYTIMNCDLAVPIDIHQSISLSYRILNLICPGGIRLRFWEQKGGIENEGAVRTTPEQRWGTPEQ